MAEVRNFLQCLQNEGLDPIGEIQTGIAAHVRLEGRPAEIQKVIEYTFRLFRLFDFSSSLSALDGLSFVLLAAHVQLERHPAKFNKSKSGKSKSILFDFSTFRLFERINHALLLFDVSKFTKTPFHFWTFCLSTSKIDFAYFPPGACPDSLAPTERRENAVRQCHGQGGFGPLAGL